MSLTLVPKVSAARQGGAAEPASPRSLVDVAVSRRQKTGALVAGEFASSGTHAHTAVRPVRCAEVAEARRPSSWGCVDESEGGPIDVPKTVGGGLSSVLRRERRRLRPGLVLTGG